MYNFINWHTAKSDDQSQEQKLFLIWHAATVRNSTVIKSEHIDPKDLYGLFYTWKENNWDKISYTMHIQYYAWYNRSLFLLPDLKYFSCYGVTCAHA